MDPIPGPVLDAMAHFREGTDDERDRSTLQAYIDSGRADPAVADALQQMLGAMGSGGNQVSSFRPGLGLPPAGSPAVISASPTPQPAISAPPIRPADDAWKMGMSPPGMSSPGIVDTYNPDPTTPHFPTPPSRTPSPVSPMPTGGYGASNIQARAARQAQRGDARDPSGGGGGRTNWKGIEGPGATSAFADINPGYLGVYADANNPLMASRQIAEQGLPEGRHAPLTAAALAPMTQSALAMAKMGMLGGGNKGHGLGGPAGAGNQLARAEGLINSLGPGQEINPAYVYTKALRMARKTDPGDLGTDIGTQVETTQAAILGPLGGLVDQDAYDATKRMLDQQAMNWLDGVAHGEIDPNLVSYPEYLRQQKKQRYLGR